MTARNNAPRIAPIAMPAWAPVSRPTLLPTIDDAVTDGSREVESVLVDCRVEKVNDSVTSVEAISELIADGVERTVTMITDGVTISPGAVGNGVTMLVITSVSSTNKLLETYG